METYLRAVIFDVDGTLYDYRTRSVLPSTLEAVERLRERGVKIVIASGRSYALLGSALARLIQPDYYVLSNGHELLERGGRPLYLERFTAEETESLLAAARELDIHVMLKYHRYSCVCSGWDEMRRIFGALTLDEGAYRRCAREDFRRREPPLGMTLKGGPHMRQQLSGRWDSLRIEYFHDPSECDVFHRGTNKLTGLEKVLEQAGIPLEACAAFGDSGNDVDMLRRVGWGVAMGNGARREAKAAARLVCGPSWEDSIRDTLRRSGWSEEHGRGAWPPAGKDMKIKSGRTRPRRLPRRADRVAFYSRRSGGLPGAAALPRRGTGTGKSAQMLGTSRE